MPAKKGNSIVRRITAKREVGILIPLVLIFLITGIINPLFFGAQNITNIFFQASFTYVIAVAMTFVLILAGLDLSVGSIAGLAGVVTGFALLANVPVVISILFGLLVGAAVGMFNGCMIAIAKIPSFIVTLSTQYIARGLCEFLTRGNPVYPLPSSFCVLGQGRIRMGTVGIPWTVVISLVMGIVAHIVLTKTTYGRAVFAIGGNVETSRHSGIKVNRTTATVYVVCGICTAFSGILTAARLGSAQSNSGNGYEMTAIASVIIGGTSVLGGAGSILGTTIGAILMTTVTNAMAMLNISVYLQKVVIGAIIIAAVAVDQLNRKRNSTCA